ncbi:hypothetical protein ACHMZP_31890 [Rhodococcus baikonurensis]|uniref:hypothetical protein n=1 Tax=Rhodococcus baikonurensis TaxID=172041 RepID=UPI0037B6223D
MAKALGQQKHPAFGLAMAAALGLEREYPDRMPITSQLNSAGQQLRDQIANACTNEIMLYGAGRSLADVADRRCRLGAARQRGHCGRVRRQQRRRRFFGAQCPCVRVAFEEPTS